MKVLPLILSGLAAVSFSVFAQQYDTAPTIENAPTIKSNKDATPPVVSAAQKPASDASANASAGASDAKSGKPKKAKRTKAKKAKDAKASAGASGANPKDAETKAATDQSSRTPTDKPQSSAGSPGGK